MFGNALSAELEEVTGKKTKDIESKRNRIIDRWIPTGTASNDSKTSGFREPPRSTKKG